MVQAAAAFGCAAARAFLSSHDRSGLSCPLFSSRRTQNSTSALSGACELAPPPSPPSPPPPSTADLAAFPESAFACDQNVHVIFNGTTHVHCGTEVGQALANTYPTVMWAAADRSQQYAIVFVDRDAISAQNPNLSPIRHGVAVNVTGAQLAAGVSDSATGNWLMPYSGPQPPVGSGCAAACVACSPRHRRHRRCPMKRATAPITVPLECSTMSVCCPPASVACSSVSTATPTHLPTYPPTRRPWWRAQSYHLPRCHRYYAILYQQSATSPPQVPPAASRLNWNFLAWAQANSLTKVSVNYFLCARVVWVANDARGSKCAGRFSL